MSQKFDDQTYYELLEVAPDAAEHEIHKAYQRAKRTYSPDSPALHTMFTPDEAGELTKLIEEAYAVLSNRAARRDYDNRLLGQSAPTAAAVGASHHVARTETMSRPQPARFASAKVPDGFGRTKHSAYEIDEDFEAEICQKESVDGEFLQRIRSYKQVALEALSREIRVSRAYLMAIERNDYEALPAEVFVRGFIVQYAKALGLEPEKTAKSYMNILRNAKNN